MPSDLNQLDETQPRGDQIEVSQLDDYQRETRSFLKGWVGVEHGLGGRHKLSVGNTAGRPSTSLEVGTLYVNTQLGVLEYWDGAQWVSTAPLILLLPPIAGAVGNFLVSDGDVFVSSDVFTAKTLATSGYVKLGGLILQWGDINAAVEGVYPVSFPIPFNTVYQVVATKDATGSPVPGSVSDADTWAEVADVTNTGFNAQINWTGVNTNQATKVRWIAIGV